MGDKSHRRQFLGRCSALLGMLAVTSRGQAAGELKTFNPVMLVDKDEQPLDLAVLERRTEYIFQYPYMSTPCFLIDLDAEVPGGEELQTHDGDRYRWSGGVGPRRSVVAFSAICAHRLSHPTRSASFIGYRPQEIGYLDGDLQLSRRADVIQCCSEKSVYDPARGAKVLGGPAPQPLAAIQLEYDEGKLYATGVYGGALFDLYFERFGSRLMLEYETFDIDTPMVGSTPVIRGDEFSKHHVSCG